MFSPNINAKTITQHEFIGCDIVIAHSTDRSLIGVSGKVVDETKNTLHIETLNGKVKVIPKKICTFHIKVVTANGEKTFAIDGKKIAFRPEDRVKKCLKVRGRNVKVTPQITPQIE